MCTHILFDNVSVSGRPVRPDDTASDSTYTTQSLHTVVISTKETIAMLFTVGGALDPCLVVVITFTVQTFLSYLSAFPGTGLFTLFNVVMTTDWTL